MKVYSLFTSYFTMDKSIHVIFLMIENLANICSSELNGPFFFFSMLFLIHRNPHALHNLQTPSEG